MGATKAIDDKSPHWNKFHSSQELENQISVKAVSSIAFQPKGKRNILAASEEITDLF